MVVQRPALVKVIWLSRGVCFAGLRGSSLRFPPIEATKPEVPRQRLLNLVYISACARLKIGPTVASRATGLCRLNNKGVKRQN